MENEWTTRKLRCVSEHSHRNRKRTIREEEISRQNEQVLFLFPLGIVDLMHEVCTLFILPFTLLTPRQRCIKVFAVEISLSFLQFLWNIDNTLFSILSLQDSIFKEICFTKMEIFDFKVRNFQNSVYVQTCSIDTKVWFTLGAWDTVRSGSIEIWDFTVKLNNQIPWQSLSFLFVQSKKEQCHFPSII